MNSIFVRFHPDSAPEALFLECRIGTEDMNRVLGLLRELYQSGGMLFVSGGEGSLDYHPCGAGVEIEAMLETAYDILTAPQERAEESIRRIFSGEAVSKVLDFLGS